MRVFISHSRGAAPRLSRLHSRRLRHISSGAGHKCGSCIQTGRVGSMCRWESGLLENKQVGYLSVMYLKIRITCEFSWILFLNFLNRS